MCCPSERLCSAVETTPTWIRLIPFIPKCSLNQYTRPTLTAVRTIIASRGAWPIPVGQSWTLSISSNWKITKKNNKKKQIDFLSIVSTVALPSFLLPWNSIINFFSSFLFPKMEMVNVCFLIYWKGKDVLQIYKYITYTQLTRAIQISFVKLTFNSIPFNSKLFIATVTCTSRIYFLHLVARQVFKHSVYARELYNCVGKWATVIFSGRYGAISLIVGCFFLCGERLFTHSFRWCISLLFYVSRQVPWALPGKSRVQEKQWSVANRVVGFASKAFACFPSALLLVTASRLTGRKL